MAIWIIIVIVAFLISNEKGSTPLMYFAYIYMYAQKNSTSSYICMLFEKYYWIILSNRWWRIHDQDSGCTWCTCTVRLCTGQTFMILGQEFMFTKSVVNAMDCLSSVRHTCIKLMTTLEFFLSWTHMRILFIASGYLDCVPVFILFKLIFFGLI